MKRFILLCLPLSFFFLFCGCLQSTELKDTAIIGAAAVDYQEGQFYLTMQMFDPTAGGGENNVNLDALSSKTVTTQGRTLGEAIADCERLQGKEIFYQRCELLILSREAAKKVLPHVVEFFCRTGRSSLSAQVAVAEGWAGDLLSIQVDQGTLASNRIASLLRHASEEGRAVASPLLEVAADLAAVQGAAALPILKAQEDPSAPVSMERTAIIQDGALDLILEKKETTALCWLMGNLKSTIFNLSPSPEQLYAVEARRTGFSIHPKLYQDRLYLDVHCQVKGALFEKVSGRTGEEDREAAEKALTESLSTDLEYLLHKLLIQNGADLFHLSQLVRQQFPSFYEKHQNALSEMFRSAKIQFSMEAQVFEASGL